jgi:hypothetical protein
LFIPIGQFVNEHLHSSLFKSKQGRLKRAHRRALKLLCM